MKKVLFLLFSLIAINSQAQVDLGGYIQPFNGSPYPVQIDSLGKGGYMVAANTTERNAIPCLRRKYGMAVYVQDLNKLYILQDSSCANTWVEFSGGGGGSATLQDVLNNGHSLTNEQNFQGTGAGANAMGINVNAFGEQAAVKTSGIDINAFGYNAAINNSGNNINAMGFKAQSVTLGSPSASDINAIGWEAGEDNSGSYVNLLGHATGFDNSGSYINALGAAAAVQNIGSNVNAFGSLAADSNLSNNLNAFGFKAAWHNSGNNVNALGDSAGINNVYSNVNLFGPGATATEDNQLVLINTSAKSSKISYGCEDNDRDYILPNKSGYFMTANFPIEIDALSVSTYTIEYPDNYQVVNASNKDSVTLIFPDPSINCLNAGQRLIITNIINADNEASSKVKIDQTYPVYYRGTNIPITILSDGATAEFYSDGTAWRSISSLPEPVVNLDMNALGAPYYIHSNGTYNIITAPSFAIPLVFPVACDLEGAHITIINRDATYSQALDKGTTPSDCPNQGIYRADGVSVNQANPQSTATYIAVNGEWIQIFERH